MKPGEPIASQGGNVPPSFNGGDRFTSQRLFEPTRGDLIDGTDEARRRYVRRARLTRAQLQGVALAWVYVGRYNNHYGVTDAGLYADRALGIEQRLDACQRELEPTGEGSSSSDAIVARGRAYRESLRGSRSAPASVLTVDPELLKRRGGSVD